MWVVMLLCLQTCAWGFVAVGLFLFLQVVFEM